MNLTPYLSAFVAVVEEQNFTRAAHRLHLTTTAVSKQIKQLEYQTRQQLIERSTRRVKVTEIGEQLYQHCKRIEQETQNATAFIQALSQEPHGRLKILASRIFADTYLAQNLYEFYRRYPKIQLEIEINDRFPDVEREDFDIVAGFRILPQTSLHLRQHKLFNSHYLLCASESYLKTYGTPQTPQDLKKHKLINHPLRQPINLVTFKDGTQIYMDLPEIVVNSLDVLIMLCCDGAGILIVGDIQVRELLQEKKLIRLLPDYPMEEISIYLFYRHIQYEQRKIRCFIDYFSEKIATSPP